MRKLVIILALLLSVSANGYAQYRMSASPNPLQNLPYESDILSARPVRYFIGMGLGALMYQHTGEFMPDPDVCHCVFSDYNATKFHYAAEFSIQYPKLGFALKFLLQYLNVGGTFSYQTAHSVVVPGDNPNVDATFEKTSNVDLSYVSFTPGFAWYIPRTSAFVLGGIDIAFPVERKYDNIEKIIDPPGLSYDSLTLVTEHAFLEKSEIPEAPTVRVGVQFAIGMDFRLSQRFYMTPQFGATLPLNSISNTDANKNWKVTSEYALLIFKYRL